MLNHNQNMIGHDKLKNISILSTTTSLSNERPNLSYFDRNYFYMKELT